MHKYKNENGMALPAVIAVMLIVFTGAYFALSRSSLELRSSLMTRKSRTASALANNVATDLLRQFSQNYQENHYDSALLARNPALYGKGFSSLSLRPNSNQHFLAFDAEGAYGEDVNQPQNRKRISGVIKFISDMTTFGTMSNGNFVTTPNNVTYVGKVWINGTWTVNGANTVVQGGPVFVNGNLTAAGGGSLTVNGNLYRTGARAGAIAVNGSDNTFVPQMTWPSVDRTFYDANANVTVSANANLRFDYVPGSSTGTVRVGTHTFVIPPSGFIIYGKNCTLTSSGTVRGKVTVVSLRVSGGAGGNIVIDGDLKYATAGSTSNANPNDSFGAIASENITWQVNNKDLYVSGTYFVDSPGVAGMNTNCAGCANKTFSLFGTRNKQIAAAGFTNYTVSFDPNLDTFPPPGLPEKPSLVSWRIK